MDQLLELLPSIMPYITIGLVSLIINSNVKSLRRSHKISTDRLNTTVSKLQRSQAASDAEIKRLNKDFLVYVDILEISLKELDNIRGNAILLDDA